MSSPHVQFSARSLLGTLAVFGVALGLFAYWHVWLVTTFCLAVILHQGFVRRTCRYRVELIAGALFVANLTGYWQLLHVAATSSPTYLR